MPAADSIDHRLAALLEILDARGVGLPPAADRGALDFRRVRVGGQSQGGGHAGFIAREQVVERSCFLGSIVDAVIEPDGSTTSAEWLQGPWATGVDRLRGLVHVEDEHRPVRSWPPPRLAGAHPQGQS